MAEADSDRAVTKIVVNEKGERVIPASRRPDGTWRKERVVRDGYTPQEEQRLYQLRGVVTRQNVPLCPGMDNEEVLGAQRLAQGTKGKSAKRNEKKREKQQANGLADQMEGLSTASNKLTAPAATIRAPASPATPAADPVVPEDPAARLEKDIKKLKKKMRECDALLEKQTKQETLTEPEKEKLGKLPGWQAELTELESKAAAG